LQHALGAEQEVVAEAIARGGFVAASGLVDFEDVIS
jgi:hypothetical protein